VLREGFVVCYTVECGWVVFAEGWMRVLAVQAFLETVDPEMLGLVGKAKGDEHGFPVEAPCVGDAAAVGQLSEVYSIGQGFKACKIFFEWWGVEG